MDLEIQAELMKMVKSNKSVYSIFHTSLCTLYKVYRKKLIDEKQFQKDYNALLFKCSLMTR